MTAQTESYSTSRDRRPISGDVDYFGMINEIIELDYYGGVKVVLFKCQWADVNNRTNGVKVDDYGFTLVNSERFSDTDEPFVLASQVQQGFYVENPKEKPWQVVQSHSSGLIQHTRGGHQSRTRIVVYSGRTRKCVR